MHPDAGGAARNLRRSAVRTIDHGGVARSDAMKLTGHKTESVYRRYAISESRSLKATGDKLAAYSESLKAMQPEQPAPKVVNMDSTKRAR